MKGSLTVVAFFCAGCLMGVANDFQFDLHDLSMYVLYALMFQVGIGIGSNKKLKELVKSLRPKMLLVPMATIVGTLLFSAFASLHGGGQRICLLFAFLHSDYAIQGTFHRPATRHGAGHHRPACQYLP